MAFTAENLPGIIRQALDLSAAERQRYQAAALARVQQRYSWDAITTEYEVLLGRLAG